MGLFRYLFHFSCGGAIPFFELALPQSFEQAGVTPAFGDDVCLSRDFLLKLAAKCRDL